MNLRRQFSGLLVLGLFACTRGDRPHTRLVLAATTSIDDSGLLDVLAAEFAKAHPEIELSPIAVGTGQAIELARQGNADVVFSHDSVAEMALVRNGIAKERRSVMYNDFVIAGTHADPAGARGNDAIAAFRAIATRRAPFVSRGDDSGTHRKELALWRAAGVDPHTQTWYVEAGLGMGDALLLAGQKRAYILTDRATYLRFRPRIELDVLCEGDPLLLNHYGVTVMNGKRAAAAEAFASWVTSSPVQQLIGEFGRADLGQPLFIPVRVP